MNRRSFLGRLVAGVAAVLGAGMVAPKAEAATLADYEEGPWEPSRVARLSAVSGTWEDVSAVAACPQCFTTMRPPQDDLGGVCVVCWRTNNRSAERAHGVTDGNEWNAHFINYRQTIPEGPSAYEYQLINPRLSLGLPIRRGETG